MMILTISIPIASYTKVYLIQAKVCHFVVALIEPAHEIMVLITKAISEGSGEPAHAQKSDI